MSTLISGCAFGKSFEVSEKQLNTYINEKYCTPFSQDGSGIENICIYFKKGEDPQFYAKIYTKSRELAVRGRAQIYSVGDNGEYELRLYDSYIGELKLSEGALQFLLPKILNDGKYYTVESNIISVNARYTVTVKNRELEIYLMSFEPADEAVVCRTNSLTGEALNALEDYISSDEFRQKVSDTYKNIKDRIGAIFSK